MRRAPTKIIQTANIRSTFNYKEGELIRINPCRASRKRKPISKKRYRNISFEVEAYDNENNLEYKP